MFLEVLAMVVGILVLVTRLPGVFVPEAARKMLRFMLERRGFGLAMFVVASGVGGLFIWSFRLYRHDLITAGLSVPWQGWTLLAFGVAMTAAGLVGLAAPNLPFGMMAKLYVLRDSTMRLLCVLGVVAGAAIAWLGWSLPKLPS